MKKRDERGLLCDTAGRPIDRVRKFFAAPKGEEDKVLGVIERFLKKIDDKKQGTVIGRKKNVNYERLLQGAAFPGKMSSEDDVIDAVAKLYEGVVLWSHPLVQVNVVPPPTTVSIAAAALAARYNENAIWDHYSMSAAQSEVLATGMLADLVGYDQKKTGGLFTFGGTACNLYAARIGIEKADPGTKYTGLKDRIHFFCSDLSHYSIKTAAIWTGIGLDNVKVIPTDDDGVMKIGELESAIDETISAGARVGDDFCDHGDDGCLQHRSPEGDRRPPRPDPAPGRLRHPCPCRCGHRLALPDLPG